MAIFAAANLPPAVSEKILRGDDALKSGRLKSAVDAPAAAQDHAAIARELDKVTWPTPKARDAAVKAAQYVYDGERDRNGSANWRAAVHDVTNGLADWAGAKVPLPVGMDQRQFVRALQDMDMQTLMKQAGGPEVFVGGVAIPVGKLAANMATVKLIPAGQGRYALESGGHMVLNERGQLLRITVGR